MIKKSRILPPLFLLAWLPAGPFVPAPAGRSAAEAVQAFPVQLLEGLAEFDLALQVHADIRGNVGPCG